ncbi:hypothetical protein P9112_004814 [Eukaryota sp. TZLM1-RC]
MGTTCSKVDTDATTLADDTSPSQPMLPPNLRRREDSVSNRVQHANLRAVSRQSASRSSISHNSPTCAPPPLKSSLSTSSINILEEGTCKVSFSSSLSSSTNSSFTVFGDVTRDAERLQAHFSFAPTSNPSAEWFCTIDNLLLKGNSTLNFTLVSPNGDSFSSSHTTDLTYDVFTKLTSFTIPSLHFSSTLFFSSFAMNIKWMHGEFMFFSGDLEYDFDGWSGLVESKLSRYGCGWKLTATNVMSVCQDVSIVVSFPLLEGGDSSGIAHVEIISTRFSLQRNPPSIELIQSRGDCDYQSNLSVDGHLLFTSSGQIGDEFVDFDFSLEFNGHLIDESTSFLQDVVQEPWQVSAENLVESIKTFISNSNYDDAEAHCLELWNLYKPNVDPNSEEIARTTRYLGEILIGKNNFPKAEALLRHSVNICENLLDSRFDDVSLCQLLSESLLLLGQCCNLQEKPQEAIFYLLIAEDSVSNVLPLSKLIENRNGIRVSEAFDKDVLNKIMKKRKELLGNS